MNHEIMEKMDSCGRLLKRAMMLCICISAWAFAVSAWAVFIEVKYLDLNSKVEYHGVAIKNHGTELHMLASKPDERLEQMIETLKRIEKKP